jgi:hypothetical protein
VSVRRRAALLLAIAGALAPAPAAAAPRPRTADLMPYNIEERPFVLTPTAAGDGAQERVLSEGDEVFRAQVAYPKIALLGAPLAFAAGGQSFTIPQGAMLLDVRARGGVMATIRDARVFCLQDRVPARVARDFRDGDGHRYYPTVKPCLVDRDGDGRFEASFLAGTNWGEDMALAATAPTPYLERADLPLPDSYARVRFEGRGLLLGSALAFDLVLFGQRVALGGLRFSSDGRRWNSVDLRRPVAAEAYPLPIAYETARIDILSYDAAAQQVRLRVGAPLQRTQLKYTLVTNTTYIYIAR